MSTGIGNLYKAEVLFLRGLNPWQPAGEVADLGATAELARRLLEANKDRIGQVTTGRWRRGEETWCTGGAAARAGLERAPVPPGGQPGRRPHHRVRGAPVDRYREASRIVSVTKAGQAGLRDWLGVDLAELRAAA